MHKSVMPVEEWAKGSPKKQPQFKCGALLCPWVANS